MKCVHFLILTFLRLFSEQLRETQLQIEHYKGKTLYLQIICF